MAVFPDRRANDVYLVSADAPGCGSSTLAQGLTAELGDDVHLVLVGQKLRQILGVTDEASMGAKLSEINDPHSFDPVIYGDLPDDKTCIVEGKLATTVGPQFIDTDSRRITSIDLTCPPLIGAKRILQREGVTFPTLMQTDAGRDLLLGRLSMLEQRAAHDLELRDKISDPDGPGSNVTRLTFDTSQFSTKEIVDQISGNPGFEGEVTDWELRSVRETMASLASLHIQLDGKVHPTDVLHYEHQFGRMRYCLDRLGVILDPVGIAEVRHDLKNAIIDCWFGLMMKEAPRFFKKPDGTTILDNESRAWTPEFYKIGEAWPILSGMLKDKSILDPFAGAGTLVNLLVARNIPSEAVLSDIAYEGGKPVDKEGHTYMPKLNGQIAQMLFDDLPSWYKPDFSPIKGYVTASANRLPFADDSFDYVVADPPYGKNCASGGLGLLLGSMPNFNRVARNGSLLMVPMDWVKEIRDSGYNVRQLTNDVSRGHSKLPVCYILVEKDTNQP